MARKQSVLGRLAQLARADVGALLGRADDPQAALDRLVRDGTSAIAEAEEVVVDTIGVLRLAESDHAEDVTAAKEWGAHAVSTSQRADELRASGETAAADRFDQLARVALGHQLSAERDAQDTAASMTRHRETLDRLKAGVTQVRARLEELSTSRDEHLARARDAQAHEVGPGVDVLDPMSEVARFTETIRREEARASGDDTLAASQLDDRLEELEDAGRRLEVEEHLRRLKDRSGATTSPTAAAPDAQ